jgi:hypothetical protein
MFCDHYGVSISFFVSGGPNTASRRTKTLATLGHRFNPIHQHFVFLGILYHSVTGSRLICPFLIFLGFLDSWSLLSPPGEFGHSATIGKCLAPVSPVQIPYEDPSKTTRKTSSLQCLQPLQRKDHVHAMSSCPSPSSPSCGARRARTVTRVLGQEQLHAADAFESHSEDLATE